MLTLEQYNQCPRIERIQILEDFGIYLEVYRHEQKCKVALFDLYGFYVEVWLDEERDKIVRLYSFDLSEANRLDQYLQEIDLAPVLALI